MAEDQPQKLFITDDDEDDREILVLGWRNTALRETYLRLLMAQNCLPTWKRTPVTFPV
jgi:hypothetical protein